MALWGDAGCYVSSALLTSSLLEAAPLAVRQSDKSVATSLGLRLKKIFGTGSIRRSRKADGIYYLLSPVNKLRSDFDRYAGIGIDWGDSEDIAGVIEGSHGESSAQHNWH